MNLSSKNLKLVAGVIYLLVLIIGLYYLFSFIDLKDLSSYEFIRSHKYRIIEYKNNNFFILTISFFIFSIIWVLLLGFAGPLLLFSGFVFGKWYGLLISLISLTFGATLLYTLAKLFFSLLLQILFVIDRYFYQLPKLLQWVQSSLSVESQTWYLKSYLFF